VSQPAKKLGTAARPRSRGHHALSVKSAPTIATARNTLGQDTGASAPRA
jgi:hypothetical protein